MSNIRIDLDHAPFDGERIVFKAPCDASDVTGLKFYYNSTSAVFTLCDTHGNDVGNIDDVFADEALVTVILDIDTTANTHKAFIQNADTNAYLEGKFDGKANKSSVVTATLLAASWSGSSAPYTYTLSVTGVTATSNQEILPTTSITFAQLEALQAANIQDGGQSAGSITLKAFGDKPTVDIPIRIVKRGD